MQNPLEQSFQNAAPGRAIGPDTVQPTREEIQALAYELWKARGCPQGSPESDWLNAEHQLRTGADDGGDLIAA